MDVLQSKILNNKINDLHEKDLQLVYDNWQSTFKELFSIDNSVSIHHSNLQVLATELYKVHYELPPELMNNILKK